MEPSNWQSFTTRSFSESRIAIMLEQFAYLLSQIAEKPERKSASTVWLVPSTRAFCRTRLNAR